MGNTDQLNVMKHKQILLINNLLQFTQTWWKDSLKSENLLRKQNERENAWKCLL